MAQRDEDELLHEICRNASMGVEAIQTLLKDIYDEEFAYELNVQADKMQQFGRKAGKRLRENGTEPSEPTPVSTAMLKTAIRMKTLMQNETKDLADLMYKGNERGMKELKHAVHKYKQAGIYATELAREMIDFEEENLHKMSSYMEEE